MNINQIKEAISLITEHGGVPFIKSSPGIGKSDTVRQFAMDEATRLGLAFWEGPENYDPEGYGFIDLRLATIDTIDLSGLPLIDPDASVTKFTRSPYIAEAGHGVLFLDELPQAKPGNQASLSQLILDKRVGSHALGENWKIIAAGNRVEDRAATHKMPTHITNRLTSLDLDFSIDVFSDYMYATNVHEAATAFAKFRPNLLESFSPDNDVNCTPRSFISATKYINAPEELQFSLMSGTIGEGATAEFLGFTKIYLNLPPFSKFVTSPEKQVVPEKSDILYATVQMLASNVTDKNIKQVYKFVAKLENSPEYVVMFWKNAIKKTLSLVRCDEYKQFSSDNKDILI